LIRISPTFLSRNQETVMTNPFDDAHGVFSVLRNDEGQFSLWPDFAAAPAGWTVEIHGVDRDSAVAYIEEHWQDLRPQSLRSHQAG
jgi:uncharacterized protein YbdZ (MbtH family)